MDELGAALVVNGSYVGHDGRPNTPVVSGGSALGPNVRKTQEALPFVEAGGGLVLGIAIAVSASVSAIR